MDSACRRPATSPTYALVHRYQGRRGPVFHLDCYRLRSPEEAADLDWEGLLPRAMPFWSSGPSAPAGGCRRRRTASGSHHLDRPRAPRAGVALMRLALETATDRASVALGTPGTLALLEENIQGARRHAAALLPSIETLLGRAGATLDDVRGVALSDGPGSFTGLRVGAALVKALARARRLPFWTAPSLMVRAAGVAEPDQLVVAIGNALRGEVYSAGYRFTSTEIVTELIPLSADRRSSWQAPLLPIEWSEKLLQQCWNN